MRFKHLLIFSALTVSIVSCRKDNGVNFTADSVPASIVTTVTKGADAPPAAGDDSNLLLGNPTGASTDIVANANNYLIDQGYYVESYNATKGTPNWVSWHLTAADFNSTVSRSDNFAAYGGLPASFYQVQATSYSGSGFDRGHNCPSGDRTGSQNANTATFLMTNMIPQAPVNNQQTWANLENYIRAQVLLGNEAYIVMGNYGSGGVGSLSSTVYTTINGGHINVPSNVWKIAVIIPMGSGDLARISATSRIISVNTPNINTINSDWKQYITTMKSIETATGFSLLSALPQSVHDALAAKVDPGI